LTGEGLNIRDEKKARRVDIHALRRRSSTEGLVKLGAANDLVAWYPEQIVAQVDIEGILLLGDHFAGNPLTILENQGLEHGSRCERHHQPGQTRSRNHSQQTHRPSIRYMKGQDTLRNHFP